MNLLDKRMILGINYALQEKKIDVKTLFHGISLDDFLNKLQAHSVESLVYTALSDPHNLRHINEDAANRWKKNILFSILHQERHLAQIENFFKACNEANIPVIALKGLLLRELYPNPSTRTMCDADILVHEKDLDAMRMILTKLGYKEETGDVSGYHLTFSHPNHLHIEVHWTLYPRATSESIQAWGLQLWKHCVTVQLGHTPILSLSVEDNIIFLCLHMLSHVRYYGFGIRQLCDFYLFIEHNNAQLDWNHLNSLAKELNISTFLSYIMTTCENLFRMILPSSYLLTKEISSKQLNYFIDTLLQGGVYGLEDRAYTASIMLSHLDTDSHFKGLAKIIFPNKKRLSEHYPYLLRCPYLYAIAWLQNLWRLSTRHDFSLYHKLSIFLLSSRRLKQRNSLLKELES